MNENSREGQYIPTDRAFNTLSQRAADLEREARALQKEAEALWMKREGVLESLRCLEGESVDFENAANQQADVSTQSPLLPESLSNLTVEFEGAKTYKEKVLRVAVAAGNDAVLNTSEVARFLEGCGQTTSSLDSTRTSVHRAFDDQPELFEKVEEDKGNWRLIQQSEDVRYDEESDNY